MKIANMMPVAQYITRTSDSKLLQVSSSGDVFTEIARVILSRGGVVVGAGCGRDLRVEHKIVEDEVGLDDLRGSKYVTSDLSGVLPRIKSVMSSGRKLMFVGTPCQTAAVRKMCGEDDNLYLCALICQSCAPAFLWQKYIHEQEKKYGSKVVDVKFRDKRDRLPKGRMIIRFEDGAEVSQPLYDNGYMRATGLAARDSCLRCPFRGGKHGADLQIGDCWGGEDLYPAYADNCGASVVLVCTNKGSKWLEDSKLTLHSASYADILEHNPYLEAQFSPNKQLRERFFRANERTTVEMAVVFAYEGAMVGRVVRRIYHTVRHSAGFLLRKAGLR